MRILFDGEIHVHYGQFYVESDDDFEVDLAQAFAGQVVGLCGGAREGALFLQTGLHTGKVGLAVELHDEQPVLDDAWEEAVEVPFTPVSPSSNLLEWAGAAEWSLDLEERSYRVRYCARGMAEGRRRTPGSGRSPNWIVICFSSGRARPPLIAC